jgi:hypothetical protein
MLLQFVWEEDGRAPAAVAVILWPLLALDLYVCPSAVK